MDYMCVLLSLFLISSTVDSNICPSTNDVHVFGDSCDFMCHCKNNEQCDRTSGECSSGCAKGWFGPGCQYRDLAVEGASDPSTATDGDSTTCYETNTTDKPVWEIALNAIETITEIYILTKADKLQYFKNFEVLVGNTTTKETELCYRHDNIAPESKKFTLLCNNGLVGNQVKIKLTRSQTQFFICDIKINGGRNLAFKRKASQVSVHNQCEGKCNAEKAVDGHHNNLLWNKCSYTADEHNPWWEVDLGIDALIRSIQIVTFKDNKYCDIEIKNSKSVSNFIRGVGIAQTSVKISVNAIGRFVKLTCEGNRRIGLCEIYVYGDCQGDTCGYDCQKSCNCRDATIWDKLSTNCSSGCKDRWKGSQCNIETTNDCESGRYGEKCQTQCSKNCRGDQRGFCSNTDGRCFGGCNAGWKGNKCDQVCSSGRHGYRCAYPCSQRCDKQECNNTDGRCTRGCIPGWTGVTCAKSCDPGFYGHNCLKKCSDHCKHRNEYCNNVDGNCTYGCMDGWKAPLCDQACDAGFYGRNCEETCSEHCEGGNRNCNTTTGYCEIGCQPGWTGLRCVYACPSRKFGAGCKRSCASTCKNDACDHVNGICREKCKRGYQGEKCASECGPGTFGENCQEKCSTTCKNGVCSHLDGGCSNGCKPGYHGNKCEQKCRVGMFGEECKGHCSSKCNNNTCNHVTGNCTDGYKPGYKEDTCGEISEKILSDTNPCTGCRETPKPNIVLICVGILCAIVVVYAVVITILFKLKDGTNVSCSGRSNDDAITNKTNKTETVTAKAATEATNELARVNINATDDESHQYTDLTPDTEDVEAAYETIQLE